MLGPTASSRRWHSVEVGWERQSTGAAQHPLLHRFRNIEDRKAPKSHHGKWLSKNMDGHRLRHGRLNILRSQESFGDKKLSPRTKPRCSSVASRGWLARHNCETLLGWGHSGRANLSEMLKQSAEFVSNFFGLVMTCVQALATVGSWSL